MNDEDSNQASDTGVAKQWIEMSPSNLHCPVATVEISLDPIEPHFSIYVPFIHSSVDGTPIRDGRLTHSVRHPLTLRSSVDALGIRFFCRGTITFHSDPGI